jgi:hypothetical protein
MRATARGAMLPEGGDKPRPYGHRIGWRPGAVMRAHTRAAATWPGEAETGDGASEG